jgi:putative phosphoesterase
LRILVVSDTHRDRYALRNALLAQPNAEVVIHLGDGEEEANEMKLNFPEKMVLQVRGNCDWGSTLPTEGIAQFEGKRIFYTHGYTYNVKFGLYEAVSAARAKKADVLLFGHTHNPIAEYRDGLYIMNPGSLNGSNGTYGTLDITPAGIVTNIVSCN